MRKALLAARLSFPAERCTLCRIAVGRCVQFSALFARGFSSLLIFFCFNSSLLASPFLLFAVLYPLFVSCCLVLASRCSVFVSRSLLLAARCSLHITRYMLLVISKLGAHGHLLLLRIRL